MTTTLITGANKSLGLETARRLLEAGHTVYAGMRDLAAGDAARAFGAIPVQLDVTDQASVDAAIASLPELDVLVNNAGVARPDVAAAELRPEDVEQVFATNVLGIVRVTHAALPVLRRSANPVIVNVASGLGFPRYLLDPQSPGFPVQGVAYPASKAAVVVLTVQYAKSIPDMRINVTDPGYTATDLNGHSGYQTVTEGTDATVALAQIGPDGPTGEFHDRDGRIEY
jgi:NAD(P)-dependent dehydrogenase (short-subunit alcohol dehydrogenase family)